MLSGLLYSVWRLKTEALMNVIHTLEKEKYIVVVAYSFSRPAAVTYARWRATI
jgi:predicted nucleic-acid-binding protein